MLELIERIAFFSVIQEEDEDNEHEVEGLKQS